MVKKKEERKKEVRNRCYYIEGNRKRKRREKKERQGREKDREERKTKSEKSMLLLRW
jgi:hypothetical protein